MLRNSGLLVALLMGALCVTATAETLKWDVAAKFGMTADGLRKAMEAARGHFDKAPDAVVILEIGAGSFWLEDEGSSKGTVDLSGIKPGPNGRLIFQGKGIDQTVLVFADNKHALYGRDVHRVTFSDMHMTRKGYSVSQGLVVDVAPGKVVLDIQPGFPTPGMIFNPHSEQGRFLRRYTNSATDPQLIEEDNEQIPWAQAKCLEGLRWELALKRKKDVANYSKGDLIGIKSKHSKGDTEFGGQTYWFFSGSDFLFDSVKWTHKTRGVFRGGFEKVQFVDCVTDRAPAINGQTPCLASPGGGPQIGQPNDPPTSGHLVKNCRFIASGDDAVAFFNATGVTKDCYIRDAFCRGILIANAPKSVVENNTLIRSPIQQSKDWRFHGSGKSEQGE
ncbi:right-handed parallel beta-helix repeat-containing protein [Haloferula sp.]|uniref:right-handed parallel beta-helix repeat-containing protein n=1 Tax=Haloferula sp. TaxID=2497595 RepID=UPI00329B8E12